MRKIVTILVIVFVSCVSEDTLSFNINLPQGFEKEVYKEGYDLLTASKYINGDIDAMIEIRYSDDWSFSYMTNDDLIREMLETDKLKDVSSMSFDNFTIQTKEKMYFKNIGDCFYAVYSGDYYENGVRVTNVAISFIKNEKLFTLIGSTFPDKFSNYHKQFLKSFETFKL